MESNVLSDGVVLSKENNESRDHAGSLTARHNATRESFQSQICQDAIERNDLGSLPDGGTRAWLQGKLVLFK